MSSLYGNLGKSDGTRDPVDRYETPDSLTRALVRRISPSLLFDIREPACGTGRMARVMTEMGYDVHATDIVEHGVDFLQETDRSQAVITNPPYRGGLAEAFVRHALEVCDGPVAMLLRLGFLTSQKRYKLFREYPPSALMVICPRVYFFKADGERISGQMYDHCWLAWNTRPVATCFLGEDELDDVGKS
jgi:predicted RNA methylase